MFIEKRANIEQFLPFPAPSSLAIQDLVVDFVVAATEPGRGATPSRGATGPHRQRRGSAQVVVFF